MGRIEGNRGAHLASGAYDGDLHLFPHSGFSGEICCGDSLILGVFAWPTSFRGILQSFVPEELLLSRGPKEFIVTVDANHRRVAELTSALGVVG